jgi:flagellar hook protein FlgE
LHSGTAADLLITSTSPAFGALGFASPVTVARTGGGTAGTGFVVANDVGVFQKETISGGAVTAFNAAGTPVQRSRSAPTAF